MAISATGVDDAGWPSCPQCGGPGRFRSDYEFSLTGPYGSQRSVRQVWRCPQCADNGLSAAAPKDGYQLGPGEYEVDVTPKPGEEYIPPVDAPGFGERGAR